MRLHGLGVLGAAALLLAALGRTAAAQPMIGLGGFPGFPACVAVGVAAPSSVQITNVGNEVLIVKGVSLGGINPDDFSVDVQLPASLGPGQSLNFDVAYSPTATGLRKGQLQIASNDPITPVLALALSGTGSPSQLRAPTTLDFGPCALGQPVTAPGFQIVSCTPDVVTITGASLGMAPNSWFSLLAPLPPFTVQPFQTVDLTVTATAQATLPYSDVLTFATDLAQVPSLSTTLSAVGVQAGLSVSPLTLDFGTIAGGSASDRKAITIANTGNADLAIANLLLLGNNPEQFQLAGPGGQLAFTLEPGKFATASVAYRPVVTGVHVATLAVIPADPLVDPVQVRLTGAAADPKLKIDALPTAIAFPTEDHAIVFRRDPSKQTVTLRVPLSVGGPVRISDISASTGDFTIDATATSKNLTAGGTTSFDVYFTPQLPGVRTGTITVSTLLTGAVVTIPATGEAFILPRPATPPGCGCRVGRHAAGAGTLPWLLLLFVPRLARRRRAAAARTRRP